MQNTDYVIDYNKHFKTLGFICKKMIDIQRMNYWNFNLFCFDGWILDKKYIQKNYAWNPIANRIHFIHITYNMTRLIFYLYLERKTWRVTRIIRSF